MRRNEGRTVGLYTMVSPREKEVIDQKMAQLGTANLRAYLRKMAVGMWSAWICPAWWSW